ncbi:MAG: MaoC family dehydratase N-terminal domain-containing protein [Xanthobacteraceae bacterium]|nr:MaoC family dehydratase N-terminal domain-containing protein [Xanthobacteraceae bacterium]
MTGAGAAEFPVTTREDVCALPLVRRTAALLDRDPLAYRDGDPLPRGWQFTLFTQETRQSDLAADGFTPLENDIPGFSASRVMLGGRRIAYHRDLMIGEAVRQDSQIVAMAQKQGRSGPLAIVTRRSTIYAAGSSQPAIVEDSDMVYRAGTASGGSTPAAEPAAEGGEAELSAPFLPTTAMLFRYSALSFNAHRIHYDAPYTMAEEGYPGLVVNGGLIALALIDWCQRFAAITTTRTELRSVRPLYCGRPAMLKARRAETGWQVWAEDENGLAAQQGLVG